MKTLTGLVVLGLLAAAGAGPSDLPKCARECPIAGAPKLAYKPEKTYSYSYTGFSEIHMKDVEGGVSKMEWTSEVDLTWLSPCDMAITFKNPSFDGTAPSEAHLLTRYPLVVAISDGRVLNVCSHPEDDTWSINLKKGVASALQNSLPSNSTINSGLFITETGINGKCPTHHLVEHHEDKIVIKKTKNLRFCNERFADQHEMPRIWHKLPLPMKHSYAKCQQQITRGIYTSITCEDKYIIKPFYGSHKYVKAKQISKLEFRAESREAPQAISNLQGNLLHRTLLFDHETLKKQPEKIPQMQQLWKEICEKTQHGVEKDTASLVNKAIQIMRNVPEEALDHMLQKVKSGEICSEKHKIENIFLDALAFIQEASAVKPMIQEIVSGHIQEERIPLYTVALYLTPRPNIRAVEALKPLFERIEHHPMTVLAAGTMVHTYCKHHLHCYDETPVKQIAEILGRKVQQQCSPSEGSEALSSLKTLGNMGVLPSEVARSVIRCMETEGVEKTVRVAAAQAFRNIKCNRHRETIKELVKFAVNPIKDTEVRIAAYLSAVKCAEQKDLDEIMKEISKEDNTQVRGFILSHLLNLHESFAPQKEKLRYLLSTSFIPANFTKDIRKYSRNIDLSYYYRSVGMGAGVESNIIYAPGSFIPQSLTFNLSSEFGVTPVNLGEFGVRLEGIDPILRHLFGPNGYLKKSSVSDILNDITRFVEERGADIINQVHEHMRERRSIDLTTISHLLHKLYGDRHFLKKIRADFFARFSGQEIYYKSLAADLDKYSVVTDLEYFYINVISITCNLFKMQIDTARTVQMDFDFALPTTQGIPLKMKMDGTVVLGLKKSRYGGLGSVMRLQPSISMQVNGFIGFDSFLAKCGVKTKNMISSNNEVSLMIKREQGMEIELELPRKMELFDFKSETFLMKAARGQQETKIHPQGVRPVRIQKQHCFHSLAAKIGLQLCYDMNLPNIFQSEGLPLGPPSFAKFALEKVDSSMQGYKLKIYSQGDSERNQMKVEVEALGTSVPRMAEAIMTFQKQGEDMKISAAVASESSGGIKVQIKKKWSESEKEVILQAFASRSMHFPPETEALDARVSSRNNGMESEIHLLTETKNSLKNYVDHRFEVQGVLGFLRRTGLPYPKRLEKFDFRTIIGYHKIISLVQKRSESEYITTVKFKSREQDWFALESTTLLDSNRGEGIVFKTAATTKVSSATYKAGFDIYYTREKKGTYLKIIQLEENKKIVDLEALVECPGESHKAKILLDVPEYIRAIKIEAKLDAQGNHQYQLQFAFKHGQRLLLHAVGPVTAEVTRELVHLQADVRMSAMESEDHKLSWTFIRANKKLVVAIETKYQQRPTFAVEWNILAENEHETKTDFRFFLPAILDKKITAIITPKHINLSFNNLISPRSSSPRRVKGFGDFDFENKKVKVDLLWDADRDQLKKVSSEFSIISSISNPHHTLIHGGWNYKGRQYHYKTEISRSNPETWIFGRKDIKVDLTIPSQRTYVLETMVQVEQESSRCKVDTEIKFKNPENKEYRVKCDTTMEWLGRPFNFKIATRTEAAIPEGKTSSMNIEVKHEKSQNQRDAYVQVQLRGSAMNRPVQTSIELKNQELSYNTKWKIDVGSAVEAAEWDLRVSPEGGIEKCKVGLNIKDILSLIKVCRRLTGINYESEMEKENDSPSYRYLNENQNHHNRGLYPGEYGRGRSNENSYSNDYNSRELNTNRRSSGENSNERSENFNTHGGGKWESQNSGENKRSSENTNSNEENNYNTSGRNRRRRSLSRNSHERSEYYKGHYNSGENRRGSSENGNSIENMNSNSQGWNRIRRSSGENSNERPENLNLYGMSNEQYNKNRRNERSSSEYGSRSLENRNSNEQENYNSQGWNRNRRSSGENSNERPENLNLYGMSNEQHNKNRWNEQSSSEYGRRSSENRNSNEQENYNSRKWNRNRQSSGEDSNERPESLSLYGRQNENRRWNDQSSSESRWRSSGNTNSNEQQDNNSRERNMNRRYSGEDSNERQGNNRRNRGQWNSNENRRGSSENMNSNEQNFNSRFMNTNRRSSGESSHEGSESLNLYENRRHGQRHQGRRSSGKSFEYLIQYEKPTQTSHRVHFRTPSRTMEGEATYSPSEYSVRFYPKKHQNEEKYELAVLYSRRSNERGHEMRYEGRFDHPSLERGKNFELLYSRNEEKVQGTIILDIFMRPEDKITGHLKSTKTARDSIRVEAKLSGNPLKVSPIVILNAAYTSHTVGFDFEFLKHPSTRPSLIVSGKYDYSFGRNAAMAFIVKTEQGSVLDIAASTTPENVGDCSGVKISALVQTTLTGKYKIVTKLCKLGYLKITTKRQGSEKVYITRLGMEEIKNLELSITEKNEKSEVYKHIAMARIKLITPTLVHVEAKYGSEEASSLWDEFAGKLSELSSAAGNWVENMSQEIMREGGNASTEEIARLLRELKEEVKRIYDDLVHDKLIISYGALEYLWRNDFVHGLLSSYKMLWSQMREVHRKCEEVIPRLVSSIKQQFEVATEIVNGVVFGGAHWMKTGEVPEEMRHLAERFLNLPVWDEILRWLDEFMSKYPTEYDALKIIMLKIKETLKRDLEITREKLVGFPVIQEIINWILHHLNLERLATQNVEYLINKAVQESLLPSLLMKPGQFQIQIPIRRHVNSLGQALRYMEPNPIPVPENILQFYEALTIHSLDIWIWSYFTLFPERATYLLPPYNRTAMLIDGSEILTFDRSVLRAPRTPCKVLLVAYKANSLIMEHPHSSLNPQLTLKTEVGNVVIKPDFRAIVDGSEMSGNHENKGMMQIWKNEDKIKVATPFMILRAYPKNNVISVEMNSWTFGLVAGLMGTNDGEKANDWYTPQGTKAPNMQELVKSWQEDQSCQTPHIAPIDAAHTPSLRTLQCQALLGVKSRCDPIIPPDPFMKMCYASRNACDVAMAYHHLCSTKGVKNVLPLAC